MKDLTIIVRGFSPADEIEKCLDSVVNQIDADAQVIITTRPDDTEALNRIIVYTDKYDFIKITDSESDNSTERLNIALKESDGKFILILNADEILTSNAVHALIDGANSAGSACNVSVRKDGKPFVLYDNIFTFSDSERNIELGNILFNADVIKNNNIAFEGNEAEHELLFILKYLSLCGEVPSVVNEILLYKQNAYRDDKFRLEFFCEKADEISEICENLSDKTDALLLVVRHIVSPMYLFTLEPKDDNYQSFVYDKAQKIIRVLIKDEVCREYLKEALNMNPVLVASLTLNQIRELNKIERPSHEDYSDSAIRKPNGHNAKAVFTAAQDEFRKGTLGSTHIVNLFITWIRQRTKNSRFNVFARKVDWTIGLKRRQK